MYRSFYDPEGAIADYDDSTVGSWETAYMYIHNLNNMGRVDSTVTANTPLFAVFNKGGVKSYIAYNPEDYPVTVSFSDGFNLDVPAKSLASTEGIDTPVDGDITPPTIPQNLTAVSIGSRTVELRWDESTDDTAVAGYKLYRNGTLVKTIESATTTIDSGLIPETEYTVFISNGYMPFLVT